MRAVTPDTGALEGGTRIVIQGAHLLYWYTSTNTGALGNVEGVNFGLTDSHPVACFTGTQVHILTR